MTGTPAAASPSSPSSPASPAAPQAALVRLGLGVLLVLLAGVVFACSRFVAAHQHHAYDRGSSPRASYAVTAGKVYQLSSATPTKKLINNGTLATLACTWSADGQVDNQLPVTSTLNDERNRYQFALFAAPITGSVQVHCTDIPTVFVDDADDASPDWGGALLMLATVIGLIGGILAVSGAYQISE